MLPLFRCILYRVLYKKILASVKSYGMYYSLGNTAKVPLIFACPIKFGG